VRALRAEKVGRYDLLLELGRGGMAELFLAHLRGQGGFERIVALKRILPHLAQDPQFKEMFLNEGRIAAKLMHPNVCMVFELDEADGELFLVMEYLHGVSWGQLAAHVPPSWEALRLTASVIAQASEGLHYAHSLRDIEDRPTPVIHRDVSPHNLFVTLEGECKVLDFGVAKMMTDGPRTRTGVIKGKLPYMAPEQIRGDQIDGRADVFSLGVCAWEALTGKRLFDRETDFAIWKAITEEAVPRVRDHWPACPVAVDDAISQALERDRERRFTSTRGFATALCSGAGGVMTNAQVADAVRTHCGSKLAQRQEDVASAITAIKGDSQYKVNDPDIRVRTAARRLRGDVDDDAAETRDLRRDAASTVDQLPKPAPAPSSPSRRLVVMMVIVAMLAAAIAATVVAVVMSRQQSAPVAKPVEPVVPEAAGHDLSKSLDEVRKAGEELRKLRDQFHGSN
jgi:eukaryotic-like serine/threonine-protein kinase